MKYYLMLLAIVLLYGPINLKAQNSLTPETSLPRNKDEVTKQQVSFCAPGDSGRNVTWDFRETELLDIIHRVSYKGRLDSILCMYRDRTAYKYKLSGDSLLFLGYENPTTKIYFESPVPVIRFPFNYGDTVSSLFIGHGGHSHVYTLRTYGHTKTSIDAFGILLLPGNDTLRNVIRLHRQENIGQQIFTSGASFQNKDSLLTVSEIGDKLYNDSITWQVDTYQWYLPGYRYPLLETIENTINQKGQSKRHFFVSTLFTPEEQLLLEQDLANEQLREQIYFAGNIEPPKGNPGSSSGISGRFSVSCKINPVNNTATVYCNLNQNSKVEIVLVNMSGVVLYHEPPQNRTPGYYVSDIDYGRYPEKEFILTAVAGDKRESWKIKKE
ncbi:hypothetical protein [Coprobacter sp.]